MSGTDQIGIQSLEVGFPILGALIESRAPLSLTEISARIGMSPSKAHRYLVSYIRIGLVQQSPQGRAYDLGPSALLLGIAALSRLDLLSLSEGVMKELRDSLDESVTLAVWSRNGPIIVRFMENSSPVSVNVRMGSSMPLLTSALGRVFLSWIAWEDLEPLIQQELETPAAGAASIQTLDDAKALRQSILSDGLAAVTSTMFPGVGAISAPIFNHRKSLVAAIAVVGAATEISRPRRSADIATSVRSAAQKVSDLMGGFEGA